MDTTTDYSGVIQEKPIALGRRSKIFDIDGNTVLKLYDQGFSETKIKQEFINTKIIRRSTNLLVPNPLMMVTVADQKGIVFEKITGTSLMDLFQENPIRYFTYGKIIVSLHRKVHAVKLKTLPTQTETFGKILSVSPRLESNEKERLLKILNKSSGLRLCHGDFHHGNIILTPEKKYCILDWMDAFSGNYVLDVCLTAVNAAVSDSPAHIPFVYYLAYEVLKRTLALDRRYINFYGTFEKKSLAENMLLAAGIHLVRADGRNHNLHRRVFNRFLN